MDYFKSLVLGPLIGLVLCSSAYGFDSVEWGPELGMAFPQPLSVGAEASCKGKSFLCRSDLKYYATTGFFKWPLVIAERFASAFTAEVGVRYFPFSFPIFFSAGLGYRYINISTSIASFTIEGEALATTGSLKFATVYVSPSVGWNFNLSRKLLLGIDLGLQVPILGLGSFYLEDSNTGSNSDNSEVLKTNSGLQMNRIASLIIPKFTLVRLTWYFDTPPLR